MIFKDFFYHGTNERKKPEQLPNSDMFHVRLQANSGKLWSTDGSPNGWSSSGSAQDFLGQVPEVHHHQWSVPELPSPPTASGLHWQGGLRHDSTAENATAMSVPDIISPENPFQCFAADTGRQQQPAKPRRY
jgi:hypothetical protein